METNALLFIMVAGITAANPKACGPAWDAYARQTGIEQNFTKMANDYQKQIPDEVKFYMGPTIFISKSIIDKRINFTWSFP